MLGEIRYPECDSQDPKVHNVYPVQDSETRRVYNCAASQCYSSEIYGAVLAGLRALLSRLQQMLSKIGDNRVTLNF